MPTKKMVVPPLIDLSSKVVLSEESWDTIVDGRKRKKASAFAVDVACDAFDNGRERCFLKIFPSDPANTLLFNTECKANHVLNTHFSTLFGNEQEINSLQSLESHLRLKSQPIAFPLCYGYLTVPDPFYEAPVPKPSRSKKAAASKPAPIPMLNALLFQLHTSIRPCQPDDLDDAGTMKSRILESLTTIHAAGVVHRDLQDRMAWPEARLHNVFVKSDGNPLILDFDHSIVVGGNERDMVKLEQEKVEFSILLETAVEQKGKERGWGLSKEVRRLIM